MGGGGQCLPNSCFFETTTYPESHPKPSIISCPTDAEHSDDSQRESFPFSESAFETERRSKIFTALMESYSSSKARSRRALDDEKLAILRHKPGDWIEKIAGLAAENYDIPETTTLLLIGPPWSGKSSLVNRITRVFEENPSGIDRAQVSYARAREGTYFLQEYPIPRNSGTLCVYDTRSLVLPENSDTLMHWMTTGVVHGEMVILITDDDVEIKKMKVQAKQLHGYLPKKRTVNYVILVVNALSILKSLESKESCYIDIIAQTFNSPYVSFRDDKPAIVITHGDELSLYDRVFVRASLGERLGISPCMQIFDIPDNMDQVTEEAIVDLLRYCIERSDRNLPLRRSRWIEAQETLKNIWNIMQAQDLFELLILTISCFVCIFVLLRITALKWKEG